MTRLFLYTVAVFFSATLAFLALNAPEPFVFRALTVPEHVVALMDDGGLSLSVWVNRSDHAMVDPDVITRSRIESEDLTTSLELSLEGIEAGHAETYQGEVFTKHLLIFEPTRLTADFVITDAWLDLELADGSAHRLLIGTLELIRLDPSWEELPFHDLYGEKDAGSGLSRISHIQVKTDRKIMIREARIGTELRLSWDVNDHDVTLVVPHDTLVLTRFPVVIVTDTAVFYIPSFFYVKDMRVLEAHGKDIHVHTFD
jgi:hypothetical protein